MFSAAVEPAVKPLTQAGLLAAAEAATGLADWGDDTSFLTGLGVLAEALEEMAPNVEYRTRALGRIQYLLMQRLHIVDDIRRHPEITASSIDSPLVVTGLPRSGTTVSFDLLAQAPDCRTPREWEVYSPWPAPQRASFDTDPRIARLNASYAQLLSMAPDFTSVQRLDASQPGECNHQMMLHFSGSDFAAELSVPRHREWMSSERAPGMYASHRMVLQYLQWQGPRGRWIIKSPHHLFDLPGLCAEYPDANIVWTHREPVSTISSLSSMVRMLQTAFGTPVDPFLIGEEITDIWCRALLRGIADRDQPDLAGRIIDIPHRDVIRDPVAVVKRIHTRFELPFTPEHEQRIEQFLRNSEGAARLGKHRHQPEEFGIDSAAVRERLADYYTAFGHLLPYD